MSQLIASQHLVTGLDEATRPATLVIDGELVVEVREGIDPAAELVDGWLVPGFVDTHSHGAAGADFASDDPAGVAAAIDHHRRHGSTTLYASTVTESMDEVVNQIGRLRALVEAGELDGIHLEGPFLAPERKGAHNVELLCDPTPERLEAIEQASGGTVKMVTLAPERECGLEAVRWFEAHDIRAAFGHSDADAATTRECVDAGAHVVTHLFNAMRGIHHRTPGPIPWLLTDSRVLVELICDGTHLDADVVRMAIDTAGLDRVALVTDAMSATGQPDGDYMLGTLQVAVRGGVARIVEADGSQGSIAGSTLTMDRAVWFVVNKVGLDIASAVRLASVNPARVHGLDHVGVLAPGRRADLCVLDDDASLRRVMRRGSWL